MKKKLLIGVSITLVVLIAGALLLARALGPVYGPVVVGRPIFLGNPSPERYVASIMGTAEMLAVNGRSPEFQHAKEELEEKARSVDNVTELYGDINAALKLAGTKHSGLIPPDRVATSGDGTYVAPSVTRDGGITTATVPGLARQHDRQAYADTLATGLDRHVPQSCGVIVDLRGNTGGDMGPMLAGLSPLLPDGDVLEWVTPNYTTPVTIDGRSVIGGGTPTTATGDGKYTVPTAVLIDALTGSSGEATLLAFRGLDNVRVFGTPTGGYSSANIAYSMPDGAEVFITTAGVRDRTGTDYFNEPIQPDDTGDPIAWLNQQGCD